MDKLFRRAIGLLDTGLTHAAGETVAIVNGDHAIEDLDATPGRRDFQQYLLEEAAGTAQPFDWLVLADRLFFPSLGQKLEPAKGWEIWWRQPTHETLVFQVLPAANTKCFDPVDQYGLLYRVHTKYVRTEPAPGGA